MMILTRFGLITGTPVTLQETADKFGTTRERVRQVERKFLKTHCSFAGKKRLSG